MSRRLRRVLCLAVLPVAWAGTEAVVPPAGGRLLVTAERGLLTVVAEAIELQQVLQAITRQSGSPIMLVNAPAEPLPVTVTIKQQPLAHVIPRLLEALRTSGSLSYAMVHAPQQPPWVKIFFPMMANASEHSGETTQEHRRSGGQSPIEPELRANPPPAAVVASILTSEELDGLREKLEAHGAATEGLDDEQLLELCRHVVCLDTVR